MKMSVVIPCYNEAENIPGLLLRFKEVLRKEEIEVILVDNGSEDQTEKLLKQLLPEYSFAKSVRVEKNQGYGYGILAGLRVAEGDYIGWTHADLQTDPADVTRAYAMLLQCEEKCYMKGRRRGRSFSENVFTIGMGLFESCYLGKRLWDINAQPNIFPREFYQTWKRPPYDFSLDLYAMYMAGKRRIKMVRFPVFFLERKYGVSHWNTGIAGKWKFILRTLRFSRELKKGGIE